MKHLGISGGATKFAGLVGASLELVEKQNYKPDLISGISAGAITALPLAIGKYKDLEYYAQNFDLNTIFSINPIGKIFGFSLIGLFRLVTGKKSLGKMDSLKNILKIIITEDEYYAYKNDYTKPQCIVGTVDINTGMRHYYNLKTNKYITYENAIDLIIASSSIPFYTPPIEYKGLQLMDGGLRDHSPTNFILKHYGGKIDESISIYSRPKNYQMIDTNTWKPKNALNILLRYIGISTIEISKNDEYLEEFYAKEKNITTKIYFLPKVMKSLYDTNPKRIKTLYKLSRKMVENKPFVRNIW